MTIWTTRRYFLKAGAVLAAASPVRRSAAQSSESRDPPADPVAGRKLIFDEDFELVDRNIWHAGPKATTAEPGYYGRSAFARWGGEEGVDPYAIVRNAAATNGRALQISAQYVGRRMNVPNYYGNEDPEYQWISGNLQTAMPDGRILRGWREGYFEARMHMPRHSLAWSAFWLMNGRSILHPQTSIELDVVEHKGWELDLYGSYLHEWNQPGEHHEGTGVPTGIDVTQGYFRYGMLVDGATCTPYFERTRIRSPDTGNLVSWTINRTSEMDRDKDVFWPLVTLALRTDVPFPAPLTEEEKLTHLLVDYVRVYA